jgi:TPR repeat protein
MIYGRLVIFASSLLLFAATSALDRGSATTVAEPAISGIGQALPPLSDHARKKLTARAEAGDLNAMYDLAHHALRSGDGVMGGPMYYWGSWNNPGESEYWWRKAAALGDPKAMILLGHMYAEPWGVQQDLPKAAQWFEKAADLNSLEAVQALVDLYMGAWSNERDDAKANQWLTRAASMGDRHAMLLLGLRYDAGWGVREDPAEAARWYLKVGEQDGTEEDRRTQSTAWNNLGVLYELGRGVPKDESKAVELYRRAAGRALFSLPAMYNLASLCAEGHGIPENRKAAIQLYLSAYRMGLPDAKDAAERLGVQPLEIRSLKDMDLQADLDVFNRLVKKGGNACEF